ncbi:MAG: hypothetical protein WD897_01630 [Parcubacteria group bacterium]
MSDINNKSERLASAIYLITGFFDAEEPLKWKLRALSTELVSERIKDKSSITMEIFPLFSVAKTAGLVSEMNYDILVRELSQFEREAKKPLELMFPREIVARERTLPESQKPEPIKDKSEYRLLDEGLLPSVVRKSKPLKEFGAVSVKKNSRQNVIISLLKRKKEVMIKDISSLINGCSEKTIQRELSAMVRAGILRRMGEKRWSRYSLAQP